MDTRISWIRKCLSRRAVTSKFDVGREACNFLPWFLNSSLNIWKNYLGSKYRSNVCMEKTLTVYLRPFVWTDSCYILNTFEGIALATPRQLSNSDWNSAPFGSRLVKMKLRVYIYSCFQFHIEDSSDRNARRKRNDTNQISTGISVRNLARIATHLDDSLAFRLGSHHNWQPGKVSHYSDTIRRKREYIHVPIEFPF